MHDQAIAAKIETMEWKAPRVTEADIKDNIESIEIVTHRSLGGQILRWAIINTKSGFAVVGDPSCAVSAANDNATIGESVATANSMHKMWGYMGYALHEKLTKVAA